MCFCSVVPFPPPPSLLDGQTKAPTQRRALSSRWEDGEPASCQGCGGALARAEETLLSHLCLRGATVHPQRAVTTSAAGVSSSVVLRFFLYLTLPTCNILYVYIWNCFLSITKMTGLLKVKVVTPKQFPPHGRVL